MAKGPEGRLIRAINDKLPKRFHSQSMTFGSRSFNGTPDRYYDPEGGVRDLWVEYKALSAMPRDNIAVGNYSALQLAWMDRRWRNGKNVVGIVGLPNRTAVIQHTPKEWRNGTPVNTAMSLEEVAEWIKHYTMEP